MNFPEIIFRPYLEETNIFRKNEWLNTYQELADIIHLYSMSS